MSTNPPSRQPAPDIQQQQPPRQPDPLSNSGQHPNGWQPQAKEVVMQLDPIVWNMPADGGVPGDFTPNIGGALGG